MTIPALFKPCSQIGGGERQKLRIAASHISSKLRWFNFLTMLFTLLHIFSIGFKSGLYGCKYFILAHFRLGSVALKFFENYTKKGVSSNQLLTLHVWNKMETPLIRVKLYNRIRRRLPPQKSRRRVNNRLVISGLIKFLSPRQRYRRVYI